MQSPPPNPKDFASLEEYEKAVRMHEQFISMSQTVTDAINNSETEEEYNKKMEELGFTTHEDEYCESDWCQKNQECLAITLECFQDSFDEHFFWKMLPTQDKIINLKLEGDDCEKIPASWKNVKTREGQMIELCFEIEKELLFDNLLKVSFVELAKQDVVQNFCRNLYLTLQKILLGKTLKKKEAEGFKDFLGENKIINTAVSQKFLKRFENILSISSS